MESNNILAPGMEELGVRTFTTQEMAFNLTGLLHADMVALAESGPVYADLSGNMGKVLHLQERIAALRKSLQDKAALQRAINAARREEEEIMKAVSDNGRRPGRPYEPRSNMSRCVDNIH